MTAATVQSLIRGASARMKGKTRGPDHAPGRRVPHRLSFDIDTPQAKPWSRIGDGSVAQGLAHREALLQAAREHYQKGWADNPAATVREARGAQRALSAELELLEAEPASGPVGRRAVIRQELDKLKALLDRARDRLRRIDVDVLEAVVRRIDFATGRLFPELGTIAVDAGCHRNSVIAALRRLKLHGFLCWVRRTVRTGNDGEFGPQREQTSNAYFFDHRRRMASRTWARFIQILTAKLRRLGAVPAAIAAGAQAIAEPASAAVQEMRAAVSSLGRVFDQAPHAST